MLLLFATRTEPVGVFLVPTLTYGSLWNSRSLYGVPEMGRTELGCVGANSPSPNNPRFLSPIPLASYLPLSHWLCGSPAGCLVTGRSELDIIMTAMLIRPDPVFHLRLDPAPPEWLFKVSPGNQKKSASADLTKHKTSKISLCILMKFAWNLRSKM